jgi:hypothetical protein
MIKEETYDKVINEYVHANRTETPKKSETKCSSIQINDQLNELLMYYRLYV